MGKRVVGLLLAISLALCGCAAAPQREEAPTLLLGFSQLGSESAWRLGNTRSVQEAAQRAGVQLMYDNAEQKQEKQINAIRSFIAYQVDVIAFAPIVEDGWDSVLREAQEAGIPVLTTDRMIKTEDQSLYAGFIGSDFYAEGQRAGQFLIKKADAIGAAHLRIAEISGTIDSTPMRQRGQGFRAAIRADDRLEIVASVSGDFLRSKGKECMTKLLGAFPDIDVLYSHNDAMTLGAIEAIEQVGLAPGQDIIIVSVDGEQAAVDLLKAGKVNCVVECTPMIGDTIMDLAKALAQGQPIARMTYSQERVFSEFDTDLDSLPDRGY